jgi:serine/threonine-protein kinase
MILGSPAYMSPEQCKDSADVDVRSDVYSFSTILYEMLAGRTPHVAETGTELLFMHLTKTPPPLRELAPQVPDAVEAVIMRGLARERGSRFDNMESFLAALASDVASPPPIRSLPTELLSADGRGVTHTVNRTALPVRSTTFSRATGELGEAIETEEAIMAVTRNKRWPIALIAAFGLGVVMFFVLHPSREAVLRATSDTGHVTTGSSAIIALPAPPVHDEKSQKEGPTGSAPGPDKTPGSQPLPDGVGDLPSPKQPSTAASARSKPLKRAYQDPDPTTSRPTAKDWTSAERWLAH